MNARTPRFLEAGDPVVSPGHYTWHPAGIDCIEIASAFNYNLGTAIAYIWRDDYKGEPIQDLEKAVTHLHDEIKRRRGEAAKGGTP